MMKNREYLNEYKLNAAGEYVYTGKYYTYSDTPQLKKQKCALYFLSAVLVFAVIASGCINSSGMNNSFYVILPYIAEVACAFAVCWNVIRLYGQHDHIKEYVYNAVNKNIPNALKSLMFFSFASLIATIVYYVLHSVKHDLDYAFAYPIIKAIECGISFLLLKVYNAIQFYAE